MSKLIIVANIYAKKDKADFVKEELLKLIPATRKEEGCVQYDLHQDNENMAHFMFYEIWQNKELLQKHLNSQHFKDFTSSTDGCVEELRISEMSRIG